eukprot:Gb_26879 [translate_table: standard]
MEEVLPGTQDHILSYIIGVDSLHTHPSDIQPLSTTQSMDVRLRMDGLFALKEHAVHFTQEFEALYTNGPAGGGGISIGYKKEIFLQKILVARQNVLWGFDIKQGEPRSIHPECVQATSLQDLSLGIPPLEHMSGNLQQMKSKEKLTDCIGPTARVVLDSPPAGKRIPLYQVAHSRTGDKGNDLNFSIIPHFPADIERLKKVITSEWVKNVTRVLIAANAQNVGALQFQEGNASKDRGKWLPKDEEHLLVEIYEAKGINSLNVVVRNVLDGGVNCSRRIDRHGKTISDLILCQEIVLPH